MTDETKPLPAIATRAIQLQYGLVNRAIAAVTKEAADIVGIDLKDGWELNDDATAFVKVNGEKPE